jgi:hypothetical protein
MKHMLVLMVLLALLVRPGLASTQAVSAPEFMGPVAREVVAGDGLVAPDPGAAKTFAQEQPEAQARGMPGWPIPERPIPHHEPGHPSKAADYTTQVTRLNAEGVEEAVQLSGIDAMLADGRMDDPLQGNYRIIEENQILVGGLGGGGLDLELLTFDVVSNTQLALDPLGGTQRSLGLVIRSDVAAGDLNGDGLDEQIAVWLDPYGNRFQSIGEMPVTPERPGVIPARATSAPAVIAHPDGSLDLAVRGYDDALWHIQRDGGGWGAWSNAAGGLLLSGPAIVSPGDGQSTAFVIGTDNQVYGTGWEVNNRALVFDGVDDHVRVDYSLNRLPLTVGMWFYMTQDASYSNWPEGVYLFSNDDPGHWGFGLSVSQSENKLVVQRHDDWDYTDQVVPLNEWHHVAVAYQENGAYQLFWDGQQVFAGTGSSTPLDAKEYFFIGGNPADPSAKRYFAGRIDEVAVFERALSEAEVSTICRSGWDSMSGQVLGLHMDENPAFDGTILADASGQGNHGTLYTSEGGNNKSIQVPSRWQLIEPKPTDECDWTSLESWHGPTPEVPAPAAIARGSQLDLFRLGPDNTLCRKHSGDGITWGNWEKLGGMLASGPGAVSLRSDHMQVFARGVDGALWYLTYDGGDWEREENEYKWRRLEAPAGIELASRPAAIASGANQVTVYVRGSDDALWQNAYNAGTGGWGGWESLGGTLDSGPAAVSHDGQIDLFARTEAGLVQRNHYEGGSWGGWVPFGPLGCCVSYYDRPVVDTRFDVRVEAGHFMGAGRELYAIAYVRSDNKRIAVELYGVRDGFRPWLLARIDLNVEYTTADGDDDFDLAAGDIDGDGLDEIVVASADRWRLGVGGNTVWVNVVDVSCDPEGTGCTMTNYGNPWYATGPGINEQSGIYVGAGDLDGDGDDEVVVELSAGYYQYKFWRRMLWAFDNNQANRGESLCHGWGDTCHYSPLPGQTAETELFFNDWSASGGVSLGNFVPEPDERIQKAEIAWVACYSYKWGPLIPEHGCSLHVGELVPADSGYGLELVGEYDFGDSMAFAVVAADLNLDLVDEIVAGACIPGMCTSYLFDDFPYDPVSSCEPESTAAILWAQGVALAAGDFMGESLRVGPPAYRVQRNVVSPVAFINMPPKHRDLLKGTGGYTRIEISDDAYAVHVSQSGTITQSTITSKKDWALSSGFETSAGAMGHKVTTSFEHTYGQNFEASHGTITTARYEDTTTADVSDQILYNGTNYAVWEYPVYGIQGAEGEASTISVIFPLDADLKPATQTNDATTLRGDYPQCTDPFYAPSHQPYNLWSYEALGPTPGFKDYQGSVELWQKQTTGGTGIAYDMGATTKEQRTSSFHHRFQTGLEYSYEGGLSIPLVGKVLDFSFRAYVNGDYGSEQIETFETELIKETSVGVNFPSVPNAVDAYDLKAYLYWSPEDYLVLDYQTDPGGGLQLKYNEPDPAFVLPWYGFPDPDDPIEPPCGDDMKYYSGDVVVHPPFAHVGETVTITATVRNFSPVEACGVQVAFYGGDPAGGMLIEKKDLTLPSTYPGGCLNRAGGPVPVSVSWTVPDADVERIYAVIDPDDTLDAEVHDEKDLTVVDGQVVGINNNMGFGLIHVGGAEYVDPGTAQEKAYDPVDLSLSPSLTITAFIPTGNHTVTARYELEAFPIEGVSAIGVPFRLDAYVGQEEPESGLQLKPVPGVIAISYADTDIIGKDEATLTLFRRLTNGDIWEEATCPGYQIHRFPEDNLVAVPVCKTGTFVLSDEALRSFVYLPAVFRNY